MARIVLVHGAFGGAWCWEPVLPGLRAAGHTVETLDLPGHGEDTTPVAEVTLDAYAERVCGVLAQGPPAVMLEAVGCDPVIEIDTDHSPAVSRTEELVAALDRLATSAGPVHSGVPA